jgi:hypothetical protein
MIKMEIFTGQNAIPAKTQKMNANAKTRFRISNQSPLNNIKKRRKKMSRIKTHKNVAAVTKWSTAVKSHTKTGVHIWNFTAQNAFFANTQRMNANARTRFQRTSQSPPNNIKKRRYKMSPIKTHKNVTAVTKWSTAVKSHTKTGVRIQPNNKTAHKKFIPQQKFHPQIPLNRTERKRETTVNHCVTTLRNQIINKTNVKTGSKIRSPAMTKREIFTGQNAFPAKTQKMNANVNTTLQKSNHTPLNKMEKRGTKTMNFTTPVKIAMNQLG